MTLLTAVDRAAPAQVQQAAIEFEGVSKSYGGVPALRDVSFRLGRGETVGFLGPNGAGKTTAIRLLLDLIRPDSGSARVLGMDCHRDSVAVRRLVGYLPGEFDLYDRLTGAQTIAYFGNLRGGVDKAYVAELVERLELDPSRRFKEYSKGNKQKVGLVVALQHRPDLLILDEPTAGLDPLMQQTFFALVEEARRDGRTVFLSSHSLDIVEELADRIGIIDRGRLIGYGTLETLRRQAALDGSLEEVFLRLTETDSPNAAAERCRPACSA